MRSSSSFIAVNMFTFLFRASAISSHASAHLSTQPSVILMNLDRRQVFPIRATVTKIASQDGIIFSESSASSLMLLKKIIDINTEIDTIEMPLLFPQCELIRE